MVRQFFDTAILGSNPSAPATKICLIKVPISLKKLRGTFPFYKNKELKFVFNKLQEGFPKDSIAARSVGGCVRKHFSNDEIDDIDIATILSSDEIKENSKILILKLLIPVLNMELLL